MKKALLACATLLLLLAVVANAQETTTGKGLIGKGIKAGITLANITGSDATPPPGVDKKMKIGFAGGGFITYAFSPTFAIQPELLYVMKGVKLDSSSISAKLKLNYVEIPVLLKFMPEVQGTVRPSIFAGPFIGFLTTAKVSGESGGVSGDVDVKDLYKSTEFGITFGAGVDFAMGEGKITFDGRYDLGLSKIEKEFLGVQPNVKTGTIAFFVGYSF